MRALILGDIHANLPGLEAVLEDARGRGYDTVYSLGDVIGYGLYPLECLEFVRDNCEYVVAGNHEDFLLMKLIAFDSGSNMDLRESWARGPGAAEGIDWTIRQLCGSSRALPQDYYDMIEKTKGIYSRSRNRIPDHPLLDFVKGLEHHIFIPEFAVGLYHDNPFKPGRWGYVFDELNPFSKKKTRDDGSETHDYYLSDLFTRTDEISQGNSIRYFFCGHTHYPGSACSNGRFFCNPGSLMPRKGKKILSYAILDTENTGFPVQLYFVEFDFDALAKDMNKKGLKARFMEI